jgi:hypothetical protein
LFQLSFSSRGFSFRGVELLTRFEKLESLTFCYKGDESIAQELAPLLLKRIARLQHLKPDKVLEAIYVSYFQLQPCAFPCILDIEGEYQVEELYVKNTLPLRASFPKLKKLLFEKPLLDFKNINLGAFSNLRCLFLVDSPVALLSHFLLLIGSNLEKLELLFLKEELDLAEVFYFCPNLEKFRMVGCQGTVQCQTSFWSKLSSKNFKKLKNFSGCASEPSSSLPAGFIKFLVEAPLIEEITLKGVLLHPEDAEATQDLSHRKLQRLKSLMVEDIFNTDAFFVDSLAKFVKCIISSAPQLYNFHLAFSNPSEPSALENLWEQREDVQFFAHLAPCRIFFSI